MSSMILFGGGLDSGAMVELLASVTKPKLVHFDYGQKASNGERNAMRYFANKYELERMYLGIDPGIFPDNPLTRGSIAEKHEHNYMPGRNMIFASLAFPLAAQHGVERVYLGASPVEGPSAFHDAKKEFAEHFNKLTRFGYGPNMPVLVMPLLSMDRVTYLRKALITEPDLFARTFSCYESKTLDECGRCTHCLVKAQMHTRVA